MARVSLFTNCSIQYFGRSYSMLSQIGWRICSNDIISQSIFPPHININSNSHRVMIFRFLLINAFSHEMINTHNCFYYLPQMLKFIKGQINSCLLRTDTISCVHLTRQFKKDFYYNLPWCCTGVWNSLGPNPMIACNSRIITATFK